MNENAILEYLDANGVICDESLAYSNPGEYPFTNEEYHQWTNGIWNEAGGWDKAGDYVVPDKHFETYAVPFKRRDKQYWLNIMFGQGSAWFAMTDEHYQSTKE
jgi:hypothetical protein